MVPSLSLQFVLVCFKNNKYRHTKKQARVPTECTGIAGTMLTVAGCLSPPETVSIVHPPTVPAHSSLWGVAHVRRGKERCSSSPLHVREASSCRAVYAKCRTWLLLHHSKRQTLPPSHYFGPWRSYSRMYPNPWPTGMVTDTAKDSSTPLTAWDLTASAHRMHHPKQTPGCAGRSTL